MSDDNKIALYMVEGFTTTIYRESLEIDISECSMANSIMF